MSAPEGTVVHAYGLVTQQQAPALPPGIAGADVDVLWMGWAGVLVSELDLETHGPEAWRVHGEDPRWLEDVVREHHAVLQSVAETADVLPLRLPGIYADRAGARETLEQQRETLEGLLDRVRGHVELGAKIYLVDADPGSGPEERPTSGRDYLARRAAQAGIREQARARRQAEVADAHETMAQASRAAAVSPPQDPALSGRAEPMLLNASYLVRRHDLDGFVGLAERVQAGFASSGLVLEITGPWPPYNFSDLSGSVTEARTP